MSTLSPTGLTTQEASAKLAITGPNRLSKGKKRNMFLCFLSQFKDLMIIILIISSCISIYLGDALQGYIILGIVIVNALFGFVQEFRTEKALEALSAMTTPKAHVIRSGNPMVISAESLVPGDIVLLKAGDRVPADGRMLESASLTTDESLLSGESLEISKSTQDLLYMGTSVLAGHGVMEVSSIGMSTEMGKIAKMLQTISREETPLQQKLDALGKTIALLCLIVCALVSILGTITGKPPYIMFISGVSLAVAAIPEGLPAIVTASLAMGVSRMAKRNALVRRLPAVETLGCATVICTDKTGTLTQNKMTVTATWFEPGMEQSTLDAMASCVNIQIDSAGQAQGSPTEVALYNYALTKGGNILTKLSEIPFDSTKKYMVVCCDTSSGPITIVKGAPEVVFSLCKGSIPADVQSTLTQMSKDGLRTIAIAYGNSSSSQINLARCNLKLCGIAGITDPPRPESAEAVRLCHRAGIRTIMITGDSLETAKAIAKKLSILGPRQRALRGSDIDTMTTDELTSALKNTTVIARATPEHKLIIVKSLKASGEIVAMTGDGVNDSPAIKEAHIGVSMGKGGSDVTREASAISLMDDNFATLVHAIEEGRLIYRNILRFVRYMLACNLGEVLTMVIAILINLPLPLLASQLLLVNVITDGLPAMALGFSPLYSQLMEVPPRSPNSQIISKATAFRILLRGLLIGCSTVGMFVLADYYGGTLECCRGTALAMLVVSQLVYVFGCNRDGRPFSLRTLFDNKTLVVAVLLSAAVLLLSLYYTPFALALQIKPPTNSLWMVIIGISLSGLLF